jgi:hypothetical protein
LPSPAAVVITASSVGAAAKSDVQTTRAPETGELGLVFVFAFFLARGVLARWVLLIAIFCICITKLKLNGSSRRIYMHVSQFKLTTEEVTLSLYISIYNGINN